VAVVLTGLFLLSVRGERIIKYLLDNEGFLLEDFQAYSKFWIAVCKDHGPFVGLKMDPKAKRSQHTSPQKTWDVAHMLDIILYPCWLDPTISTSLVEAKIAKQFTGAFK